MSLVIVSAVFWCAFGCTVGFGRVPMVNPWWGRGLLLSGSS